MASDAEAVTPVARGPKTEGNADHPVARARRSRVSTDEDNIGCVRYFLARANRNDSTPELDREVANEGEALVEALRSGVTYYAIQEFRVIPDFTGKRPQLQKEAVVGRSIP